MILVPVAFIQFSSGRSDTAPQVSYTQYDRQLQADNLAKVTITAGTTISGEFKQRVMVDGKEVKKFTTKLPVANSDRELDRLRDGCRVADLPV